MSGYLYEGLGVSVRKRDGQGVYEFGVIVDGAFIALAAVGEGKVDKWRAAAKAAAASQSAAASEASTQ